MKQMWYIPFSKPFLHILHSSETQDFVLMFLLNLFTYYTHVILVSQCVSFYNFKHVDHNPFMVMISMGSDLISRSM